VDDGVPVNMVQRVLGDEKSTTLDLYTRRTDNRARILETRTDEDDDEGGAADALARAW
jgi:hypothetical protein